jgi:hypothetical protein
MNTKLLLWLLIILFAVAPSVAQANDMSMMLPIVISPFLVGGIIGSLILASKASRTRLFKLVEVLQFCIALFIGLPCTFVFILCLYYFTHPLYAHIAWLYTFGYILLLASCYYSFKEIFKE